MAEEDASNSQNKADEKDSALLEAFKDHAVQDVKKVQDNYQQKEQRVINLLTKNQKHSARSSNAADEYEQILQENVVKLKKIAKEDFQTSSANTQILINETKTKIHNFIVNTFTNSDTKSDFNETAGLIFTNINNKIRDDLLSKDRNVAKRTLSLSPEFSDVFVNPLNKPPEEVEAERLLQQLFEEELLEFNKQIKKDFQDIALKVSTRVDDAKTKINKTIKSELPETKSTKISNLPSESIVKENVGSLWEKASQDLQEASNAMKLDVETNKKKINDKAKYYTEKLFGKRFDGE